MRKAVDFEIGRGLGFGLDGSRCRVRVRYRRSRRVTGMPRNSVSVWHGRL